MAITTFEELLEALKTSLALKGVALLWGEGQKLTGIPRINFEPVRGKYDAPGDLKVSIKDVKVRIVAHVWAANDDACWAVMEQLFQALEEQAAGDPEDEDAAGLYWSAEEDDDITYGTGADSSLQGVPLDVTFTIRRPINRRSLSLGRVDAVRITHSDESDIDGGQIDIP
jgi:hypothetical protein